MIDRADLAIALVAVAGYEAAVLPTTLAGTVCTTCLCFLSGYVARRLIDAWARKEWS